MLTRMRQVMSVTETQYSGEDIVFIAPDSDTLSVLQVGDAGTCYARRCCMGLFPFSKDLLAVCPSCWQLHRRLMQVHNMQVAWLGTAALL